MAASLFWLFWRMAGVGACLPSLPGHGPDRGCPAPPIMSTSSVLDTPRLSSSRAGGCCRAGLWLRSGLDEVVHALLGRRAGSCLEPRVPLACGSSAYFAVVAATLCVGFVLVYHVVVLRVALHRLCSDVCMCLGKRAAVGCLRGCCCWYAGLAYVLCAACARGLVARTRAGTSISLCMRRYPRCGLRGDFFLSTRCLLWVVVNLEQPAEERRLLR